MSITNKTEFHYKVSNWVNHVSRKNNRVGANYKTHTPGAVWSENIAVNNRANLQQVKTPWMFEFYSGGTATREFFYGEHQHTQLRNFINTDIKFLSLDETQHGNIGKGAGYQMTNWLRFVLHNKLTGEQGWYNIPNGATYGDVLYETKSTSWVNKTYYTVPSDSKIEEMKAAGIVSEDYCIHEVFPKAKSILPSERTFTPTESESAIICSTFAYQRTSTKDLNEYSRWHSCMWVKRANHDMMIYRKGSGRNYIVALKDITVLTPDRRERVLHIGRPISLESEHLILKKEDSGFILHVHQINTQ